MSEPFQTREVLAGAYRGGRSNLKAMRTHVLDVARDIVLCGRVSPDHLADQYAGDTEATPTCPTCLRRDPRRLR